MSPHESKRRGFTLVELLIAMGAGIMVVAAAVMAADAMLQSQYGQTRKSSVDTEIAVGQVILERVLANAGMGFNSARFAVRVRQNVSTTLPGVSGSTDNVTAYNQQSVVLADAGTAGVVSGTDVIEVAFGNSSLRNPGSVNSVNSPTSITLTTGDPFRSTDTSTQWNNMVLLFTDGVTNSCIGRVDPLNGSWTLGTKTVVIQWLDDDYNDAVSNPSACPQVAMYVYALDTRYRFMVYNNPSGGGVGLYEQDNLSNTITGTNVTGLRDFGSPQLVIGNIVDMQVKERVLNTNNVAGCGTTMPANMYCWCNDTSSPTCSVDGNTSLEELVRGFNITLVAKSAQSLKVQGAFRPQVYDNTAGTVDNIFYATSEQSVFVINVGLGNL